MEDFKKLMKEKKTAIGSNETVKGLKLGKVLKVFITATCDSNTREDIKRYASISGAEIIELDIPGDELGVLCKKPFSISVLGVLKE